MTELGPLPEEWGVARMGDYCNVHSGYAFKSQDFCEDGILVVKIGNLQNDTVVIDNRTSFFPSEKISEYLRKFILEKDNVLIALTGATTGKIAVVPEKFGGALLNQRVGKFAVFNEGLHSPFSRFYFTTKEFQEKIKENILQSAQGNVSPKQIENIRIPLPPLPEQRAIAKVLSTVQAAKEKTEAVISATKALKKSLMKHLFMYGPVSLEEAENVSLNETEIGMVPEEWEVVRLGDVVEQRKETINPEDGDWKYVGLEHIDPGESRLKKWGFSSEVRSSKSKFYPRDVLYGKLRPYLDKGVLADLEGICSTDIIVIKPKENLNDSLLSYLIHKNDFRDYATSTMTGVNHPRTSWRALSQFFIPLPPLLEQQKIASILSAVDKKIEAEDNKKKALDELFKTLLNTLMTGKLRVNHLEV